MTVKKRKFLEYLVLGANQMEQKCLSCRRKKQIRRHDNKGERERNEECREDEYANVKGNQVVNINGQILTEHEVLNEIR